LKSPNQSMCHSCTSLTTLELPAGMTSLGSYMIAYSKVTSIVIPAGVKTIADYVFQNAGSLTSVTLHNQITSIGMNSFSGTALVNVDIPASVTSINKSFTETNSMLSFNVDAANPNYTTFEGCLYNKSLTTLITTPTAKTTIAFPPTITTIGTYGISFKGTSLVIPEGVTTMADYACYYYCQNLITAVLPSTLTSLGNYSFYYCSKLVSLTCNAVTPPALGGTSAFSSVASTFKIYVPAGSLAAYKAAANWLSYSAKIFAI